MRDMREERERQGKLATVNQTNNRKNNNNNTTTTTTTTMSDIHHPHPTLHAHFEDDTSLSTNTDTVRQQGQAAAAGPDAIPFSRPSTPTVPIEKIAFVGLGNMVRCVAAWWWLLGNGKT
jgi:hypothetical protein